MIGRTLASAAGMLVIVVGSVAYLANAGLRLDSVEHVDTVSMSMPDTNGLVVGGQVLLCGIPIGHVTDVTSAAGTISVRWNYSARYRIPVDSRYRVDNMSALGETYLSVLPDADSGPYLGDGAVIDTARVLVPTTIKELSARLTELLEQVDPAEVAEIFRELDIALPDDAQVLGNLNNAGNLLAAAITRQSGNLAKLLSTLQPLLQHSSWLPGDLAGIAQVAPSSTASINTWADALRFAEVRGPLRDGIKYGVQPFIGELQKFLDENAADLHAIGINLLPAARAGAASMETVDVGQLLDNALAATDSGDSVTVHVRIRGR